MAEQTEKASLKQPKVFLCSKKSGKGKRPGKGGNRYWKSIGLGFKSPREAIEVSLRPEDYWAFSQGGQKRKKSSASKDPRPSKKVTVVEEPTSGRKSPTPAGAVLGLGIGAEVARVGSSAQTCPTPTRPAQSSHPNNNIPFAPQWGIRAHDSAVGDSRVARELIFGERLKRDRVAARTASPAMAVSSFLTALAMAQNQAADLVERFEHMSLNFGAEQAKKEDFQARHAKAVEQIKDLKVRLRNSISEKEDLAKKLEAERGQLAKERKRMMEERKKLIRKVGEEAIARAVEEYKASEEYKTALLENGYDAFGFGYEGCRKQVVELYPNLDLSGLKPPPNTDRDDATIVGSPIDEQDEVHVVESGATPQTERDPRPSGMTAGNSGDHNPTAL